MAWMLYVLGTGTLLAVAALALDTLLRRIGMPTRWVWVAALAGIGVLAIVAPRSPAPGIPSFTKVAVVNSTILQPTRRDPGTLAGITAAGRALESSMHAAMISVQQRGSAVAAPLLLVWALGSGLLLSLLVIVTRRANLARRRWPRTEVQGIPVRIAPAVGPAVIGLAQPDIVLPSWLLQRSPAELHIVAVHEREHVLARDQLLPLGAWLVAALLPWHPAVWWAMSRLRLAIELDCDARVLHRGVRPHSYGSLLIDIAGQCAGHRIGALALADRPSHLERRLLAMKPSRARIGFTRAATLTAVAALAVVMACEARLPTSSELDAMDAATIQKTASKAMTLSKTPGDSLTFYVNELRVSEKEAALIGSKMVATVNVSKSADGKGEVRIRTVDGAKTAEGSYMKSRVEIDSLAPTVTLREMNPTKEVIPGALRMKTSGVSLSKKLFDGLVVIDDMIASAERLSALSPDAIQSIEVHKGAAAAAAYADPRAAKGVIKVVTKRP